MQIMLLIPNDILGENEIETILATVKH